MHDGMSSTTGIGVGCMLVVGVAATAVFRAVAPAAGQVALSLTASTPLEPLEWHPEPADAPARASPIWSQRFRR
jgi:hypothetical protein